MVTPIIRKVIVAAIFAGGVASAIAAYHTKKTPDLYEAPMNAEKARHAAMTEMFEREQSYTAGLSKEKTEFEKEVGNLLSIAAGDTFIYGFGARKEVNLEGRRAFFTDGAWNEYMAFIDAERAKLHKRSEDAYQKHPPKAGESKLPTISFYSPEFEPWSQIYKETDDEKLEFSVKGTQDIHSYDKSSPAHQFILNLSVRGDLKKSSKFIIEKWQFNMVEPKAVSNGC